MEVAVGVLAAAPRIKRRGPLDAAKVEGERSESLLGSAPGAY